MPEHFRICRDFGFRTLEIGIGGGQTGRLPGRMSKREVLEFERLRAHSGVTTPFCALENDFTLPDVVAHREMVARTIEQLDLAAQLGANQVRMFAGFTPLAETSEALWRQMLDAFAECDLRSQRLGLTIGIETHGRLTPCDGALCHEHTVTTDRTALSRLVHELPAAIGINYDPGNIKAVAPQDRRYCLDLIDDRINYCHLKDWRRVGAGWLACAPGDDDLDYAELLAQMHYDGVYLIEYEPTGDVEDGLRRSLAYLRMRVPDLSFP
jgi:sugar phosphate isomerase/epimerase